jgi:hypothetical protein
MSHTEITEMTILLHGKETKVKIKEEFKVDGKTWYFEHTNYSKNSVRMVEKKEQPSSVHHTFEKQYNDLNFKKLNPEE